MKTAHDSLPAAATDVGQVIEVAGRIAAAIGRRDVDALATLLDSDFVLRSPGGDSRDIGAFLEGITQIPGEILFVMLVGLSADVVGDHAVATGVQHARVRADGRDTDDTRPFVDWFVKRDGRWRLRLAVDLPPTGT